MATKARRAHRPPCLCALIGPGTTLSIQLKGNHALRHRALTSPSSGQSIQLIQAEDAGGGLFGPGEKFPQSPLRFAVPLGKEGGTLDGHEVDAGFPGERPGYQGLSGAARPREENTAGGANAEPGEPLGEAKRPRDQLRQPSLDLGETPHVPPGDVGGLREELPRGG
jgi:hypothetical protein